MRIKTKTSKPELPKLPAFHICGVVELMEVPPTGWSHVVSLWNSATAARHQETFGAIRSQFRGARVHVGIFDDIENEEPGEVVPTERDILDILAFATGIPCGARVLVHCMAGLGRSTAVAYAIACQMAGKGREQEAFESIRSARQQLAPNRLIVRIADRLLQRGGTMTEIVNAHWRQMVMDLSRQTGTVQDGLRKQDE